MRGDFLLIIPELILLSMSCLVLLAGVFSQASAAPKRVYWLAQISLLATVLSILFIWPQTAQFGFYNSVIVDPLAALLKLFICMVSMLALAYAREYFVIHGWLKYEYFVLALFAVLGMLVMSSAHNLLTAYLGLELLSLSLYAMVAIHRDSDMAGEAAMKYFVLGALASGILLYGMSILYGLSGSLDFTQIATAVFAQTNMFQPAWLLALVFVVSGIAFKLGAAPFHMWVPDVYQGAPTAVTLFISSAPKIAAFALSIRLLVFALPDLATAWQIILVIFSVLSMAIGNIIAIAQTNIKRMLAYSWVAHAGFLLLGLIAANASGYAGAMFYIVVYALMSIGAFGMVICLGVKGHEADSLQDFSGLAGRSPWLAFIMLCLMFSMAGIPPFAGFWAKWFVLKALLSAGWTWLAAAAVIFSVIGAYYYLRIVKLMYFEQSSKQQYAVTAQLPIRFLLSANGMLILLLGVSPNLLMYACLLVFQAQ